MAGVAQDTQKTLKLLNKQGEVVNYNYTGNAHKCLMAKLVDDDMMQSWSTLLVGCPKWKVDVDSRKFPLAKMLRLRSNK